MEDKKVELLEGLAISLSQYSKLSATLESVDASESKRITNLQKRIRSIERTSEELRRELGQEDKEPLTSKEYGAFRDKGLSSEDIRLAYEPTSPQSLNAIILNYNRAHK